MVRTAGDGEVSTERSSAITAAGGARFSLTAAGGPRSCAAGFDPPLSGEVIGRERAGFEEPLEIALIHHAAALAAGAGAEIHDVIGRAHHLRVVFHHHHGVAPVAQLLQRGDQARVVAGMEADGGFVEHVQYARETAPDLRGEADALHLAAGERAA